MTNKLFVAGISYNVTSEQLGAHFASAGTVLSSNVIMDKYSGQSKGFGFVEMENVEEAKKAIETLNNSTLDGRNIVVKEAKPMEPRSNNLGFRQNNKPYNNRNKRGREERRGNNRW